MISFRHGAKHILDLFTSVAGECLLVQFGDSKKTRIHSLQLIRAMCLDTRQQSTDLTVRFSCEGP